MDDDHQENVADASLLLPQDAAGGVLQVPSGNSLISRHQLGSSDNSSVQVSPRNAGRRRKRKNVSNSTGDGTPKKIKVVSADQGHLYIGSLPASRHNVSLQFPAEVWQHIFSFLPPHTLGMLLRVSKLFNKYLDPASPFMISAPEFRVPSALPALLPDAVWRASRYLFWPRMPAPLSGRSELDMWRFACSRSCQICGQADETNFACNTLPWQRGPGNSTVSPIFVFFVKCCGKCLVQTSVKEVDVLLSTSIPSVLLPGLPMAFLTADLNVVYTQSIKTTQVPTSVPLTRIYWPAQVESLRLEFEDVKRFGPAAAAEWIKGLESRGADAIHQASRWEKWYLASGFSQMVTRSSPTPPQPIAHGAPKNVKATIRPKRRAREVTEELRSQRRADIERRAGQLRPPIPPDALVDLPSFQMSLEKAEPLRDKDWNQLKQQIVSQYKKMKGAEELAAEASSENHQDEHDAETLVKIHISGLTDQFISGHLVEGQSIEQNDYGQFLVGVMAYVRKQFYAEVSKIDTRYHSVAPLRLTLGDMVWIFDHKIKQRLKDTDQDLCSCRKCPDSKQFKFHALIHHYLSKHAPKTKTIKLRERLRIEWPRDPLFESSPIQQAFTADPKPLSPRTSEMDDTYKLRLDAMAKAFKNVSKIIRDVKDIPISIEVFVLIYHVAKELTNDDSGLVSLETFVDVLNHFKTSSILATYHGLACKICMLSETRDEDEKSLFTLPGLAKHFHNVHGEGDFSLTDWRADLIWLPGLQKSQDLQSKVRRSKPAFEIISEALPWLCESEEETSQGNSIPALTNSPTNRLEAVNTASSQPDERSHEDVPRLLPASAVYVRSDTIQEQARYDTVVARAMSTNERVPQGYEPFDSTIAAHRIATEGSSIWGPSRTNSQTFSPREFGPAPGRHLSSYRPHDDYDVQMMERPNAYPYYPDLEPRREQSHAAAGSIPNGSHNRYYIRSDHQQLIPSARFYHYGESVAPYDRHDGVDARRVSNGYYTQHPGMIREYRVVSNADRFDYARIEPHRSTTPSQRAYDTFASRYAPPANRWPEF
ncbi:hypothetical protein ACQKWADRAFT_276752 [Trichoderma austrokoningii]